MPKYELTLEEKKIAVIGVPLSSINVGGSPWYFVPTSETHGEFFKKTNNGVYASLDRIERECRLL